MKLTIKEIKKLKKISTPETKLPELVKITGIRYKKLWYYVKKYDIPCRIEPIIKREKYQIKTNKFSWNWASNLDPIMAA